MLASCCLRSAGGVLVVGLRVVLGENSDGVLEDFVGSIVGATVYLGLNVVLVGVLRSLRTGRLSSSS